jgi:N-acetylmuramoyl-L-alanine amidase
MKIIALLLFLLTASAEAGWRNLERLTVAGSEYVRLAEWGESAGLAMKWNKKDPGIELTSAGWRLNFTIDSRRAELGGVTVWLSLPVINRSGVALVSFTDIKTTLEPVLFPRKTDARIKTICLDPGHGGKDIGTADRHNYEKKYTLLLARDVESELKEAGLNVVMTRTADEFIELPERALIASRHGADVFVSLHYNSGPAGARGIEVYCLAPAGMRSSNEGAGRSTQAAETGNAQDDRNVLLAYDVDKSITHGGPVENGGMKRSRFEVLREAKMPAILVEGGFMSDAADAKTIYDTGFRKRMARAIVEGILAYKHAVEKP